MMRPNPSLPTRKQAAALRRKELAAARKEAKAAKAKPATPKTPVINSTPKPPKAEAEVKPAKVQPEKPPMPDDPTQGLNCESVILAIGGLPATSRAHGWATEIARKLRRPIDILDIDGNRLGTVDTAYLTAVKLATRGIPKGPSKPREEKTAPEGKRLQVVELCMRPEGASTKELIALTGWHGCPWKWTIGNNKNGTGLCDRYGYSFHTGKVDGEVRYFLSTVPEGPVIIGEPVVEIAGAITAEDQAAA
jgi:hypothetical protein